MTFPHVNWLAIIVATLVPNVVGATWYGVLDKQWREASGVENAPRRNGPALTYGTAVVLNFIVATSLAAFIGGGDWKLGLFAGFMAGFTFVAMAFGVNYLFEARPLKLWLINAGYNTVAFSVMGLILGAWH